MAFAEQTRPGKERRKTETDGPRNHCRKEAYKSGKPMAGKAGLYPAKTGKATAGERSPTTVSRARVACGEQAGRFCRQHLGKNEWKSLARLSFPIVQIGDWGRNEPHHCHTRAHHPTCLRRRDINSPGHGYVFATNTATPEYSILALTRRCLSTFQSGDLLNCLANLSSFCRIRRCCLTAGEALAHHLRCWLDHTANVFRTFAGGADGIPWRCFVAGNARVVSGGCFRNQYGAPER